MNATQEAQAKMIDTEVSQHAAEAAAFLDQLPEYRVLRALKPPLLLADAAGSSIGALVDIETTGLDPERDKIIQFAAMPFVFDRYEILGMMAPYVSYEDPGFPIPERITELTGIVDADVRGYHIDDNAVRTVAGADIIIAHNAGFDRRFCEKRFPFFVRTPWACSQLDVPWSKITGETGTKLDYLLFKVLREFAPKNHSALDDCLAALALLERAKFGGRSAFSHLLEAARKLTVRLWATGAPFDVKDRLKSRGYKWADGMSTKRKGWYLDTVDEHVDAETTFLAELYGMIPALDRFNARDRYSNRL